jgi:hypothetical protein
MKLMIHLGEMGVHLEQDFGEIGMVHAHRVARGSMNRNETKVGA